METKAKKKGGRKGMIFRIILVVVVVLAVAQLFVLGVMGGIGPLGFLRENHLKNLPGNSAVYEFSAIQPLENSPLAGKPVIVLGSSVTYGAASGGDAVGEYLAARMGCVVTKEAVSGTTLTDGGKNSYVQRMLNNLDPGAPCDLFICQLSTNDATQRKPLGEISNSRDRADFDVKTITGAMEYIISYARETWGCPVVFFTGSRYDSPAYDAMVERLYELQEKWGVGILDLWSDDAFNDISDEDRALYMSDDIHPTRAGYRDWWGPEQERQLLAFLQQQG